MAIVPARSEGRDINKQLGLNLAPGQDPSKASVLTTGERGGGWSGDMLGELGAGVGIYVRG